MARRTQQQELVALFAADGMTLDPALIPTDTAVSTYALTRDEAAERKAAAFLLGDNLAQRFGRGQGGHAEFRIGGEMLLREGGQHVQARAFILEQIPSVGHSGGGRGHQEGPGKIQFIAQLIEQAQGRILLVHAGPAVEQLVAAAPKGQAGMAPQRPNDGGSLLLQHPQIFRRAGIMIAGQHEFLPDQQAHFIAEGVKIRFIDARAAPDAQQVHMRVRRQAQQFGIAFPGDAAEKQLGVHPVGALAEDAPPV